MTQVNTSIADEKLYTTDEVLILLGYKGRSTLWRLCRDNSHFPKPIRISRNHIRWKKSDLDIWFHYLSKQSYK